MSDFVGNRKTNPFARLLGIEFNFCTIVDFQEARVGDT